MSVSNLRTIKNEHKPKEVKDKKIDKHCKVEKDERWIKPKKYMPTTQFFKPCINVEDSKANANKHGILVDNDENYDEEEDEKKENACNLKQIKYAVDQDKKKIKTRTNEKESKTEERKIEKLIQDLCDDAEKAYLMHEKLQNESTYVEAQH